jgi:hypothetical protein
MQIINLKYHAQQKPMNKKVVFGSYMKIKKPIIIRDCMKMINTERERERERERESYQYHHEKGVLFLLWPIRINSRTLLKRSSTVLPK